MQNEETSHPVAPRQDGFIIHQSAFFVPV